MMVTSTLLVVWLTLSCQNCFASDVDAASTTHASLGCCPSDLQHDKGEHMDAMTGNCATASLLVQPVVSEEIRIHMGDQFDLAVSIYNVDYALPPVSRYVSFSTQSTTSFSQRLFSSYRILLI